MGVSAHPLLVSLKGVVQGIEEMPKSSGSLWSKVLEDQAKRRCPARKQRVTRQNGDHAWSTSARRILMKRRARPGGSRRPANGIKRRVKNLKKLIPNSESMELDGLFRETADYILSLQMRVRVMQIMVKVLTGSDE